MTFEAFNRLTRRDSLRSLQSWICPSCGRAKRNTMSLCSPCFSALAPATRKDLYRRLGEGYEPALTEALQQLAELHPRRERVMHLPGSMLRLAPGVYDITAGKQRGLHIEMGDMLAAAGYEPTEANQAILNEAAKRLCAERGIALGAAL